LLRVKLSLFAGFCLPNFGMTKQELFIEPLAHLPGIEVSLQGSIQFIGYLSFAGSATLCAPEK
jgi:hypothetical protein